LPLALRFVFALTLSGFALRSAGAVLTGPGGSSPPDTDSAEYGNFSAWPVPVPALSPYQDSEELSGAYAPPPRSGDFSRLRERKHKPERKRQSRE